MPAVAATATSVPAPAGAPPSDVQSGWNPPSLLDTLDQPTAAVLEQVRVRARLEGLLLQVESEQHYRHTGTEPLEVVYVFPLPVGAVLLGLDVTLAGRCLAGTVVARAEGERRYEAAMAEGDLPVMVEPLGDQRWRVQLGNLKPGEPVVLALRYAQLASFEQGQVRLAFPSTIAPRYGEPVQGDPLPLYPQRSVAVEHPLRFTLQVLGELARAEIACPTHPIRVVPPTGEAGQALPRLELALGETSRLDRDVVFTLHPANVASVMTAVIDPAPAGGRIEARQPGTCTVLASFRSQVTGQARERIDLKVLVDCSASMAGDGIASARRALRALADDLGPEDRFSFSRFGSTWQHDLRRVAAATPGNLNRLRALVERTEADLGGTEMRGALQSVVRDVAVVGAPGPVDVLLITDGEVDDREAIVRLARESGHRLFAVGVGSSPNEHLLREVAEATGGACEFATPGESLEAAIRRTMARLRQPVIAPLTLVADRAGERLEPLWVTPLPRGAFGGDTLHVWAGFDASAAGLDPTGRPAELQLRLFVHGTEGSLELAQATAAWPKSAGGEEAASPPPLARMAAWRRLQSMDADDPAAVALALRYQLLTSATRLLCVHERAAAEQVQDFARLHHEPAMLAAGWGGTGSIVYSVRSIDDLTMASLGDADLPVMARVPSAPLRCLAAPVRQALSEPQEEGVDHLGSVDAFFRRVLKGLSMGGPLASALQRLGEPDCPAEVRQRHQSLVESGLGPVEALALMTWAWSEHHAVLDDRQQAMLEEQIAEATERQWHLAMAPWGGGTGFSAMT